MEQNKNKYLLKKVSISKKATCLIGHILLTYLLPFIIVAIKFGIFKEDNSLSFKLTGIGLLLTIIIVIKFKNKIAETINNIKNFTLQKVLIVCKNLCIAIFFIVILESMKNQIFMLEFLTITLCVCFTIGDILGNEYKNCLYKEQKYINQQEQFAVYQKYEENKNQTSN